MQRLLAASHSAGVAQGVIAAVSVCPSALHVIRVPVVLQRAVPATHTSHCLLMLSQRLLLTQSVRVNPRWSLAQTSRTLPPVPVHFASPSAHAAQ
jgi:hypothetical protein